VPSERREDAQGEQQRRQQRLDEQSIREQPDEQERDAAASPRVRPQRPRSERRERELGGPEGEQRLVAAKSGTVDTARRTTARPEPAEPRGDRDQQRPAAPTQPGADRGEAPNPADSATTAPARTVRARRRRGRAGDRPARARPELRGDLRPHTVAGTSRRARRGSIGEATEDEVAQHERGRELREPAPHELR
jgi:hypothetical protein